jgi:hypothetical protein
MQMAWRQGWGARYGRSGFRRTAENGNLLVMGPLRVMAAIRSSASPTQLPMRSQFHAQAES